MEGDCKERNLVQVEVHDVEEGEISDSASVEEISGEAFTKQTPPRPSPPPVQKTSVNLDKVNAKNNVLISSGNGGKVWTMGDLYKYRISSTTSYSGLYNLAWAQAVNNKPLDEVFVMMEDNMSTDKKIDGNNGVNEVNGLTGNKESTVVTDMAEEGELEEGEIDLDLDVVRKNEGSDVETMDENIEFLEREKRVDMIKKELHSLNVVDVEKSFDRLCSSLEDLADRLTKLVLDISSTEKETLVQLLFSAMQIANSVYSSMNLRLKDLNRDVLIRLINHMIRLRTLFSSVQLKEMEVIISSLGSSANSLGKEGNSKTKQVESAPTGSLDQSKHILEYVKSGLANSKHKGMSLPLLDLHIDHDADSLPSPTRDLSVPSPFDKGSVFGRGSLKPEWPIPRRTIGNSSWHPYETDAVQAVSSYQQKFGQSSSYMIDKLPSPTPSGEADKGDFEMSGEVSSSINHDVTSAVHASSLDQPIASLVNSSILRQPAAFYTSVMNAIAGQGISNTSIVNPASNYANPVPRSSSARSRDPRLRLANSDGGAKNLNQAPPAVVTNEPTITSRKQKTVEELVFDGPMLKRQRKDSTGDVEAIAVTGLEDMGTIGIPEMKGNNIMGSFSNVSRSLEHSVIPSNITTHGNDKSQILGHNTTLPIYIPTTTLPLSSATSTSLMSSQATAMSVSNLPVKDLDATTSLHSLLRDASVNPSILMNILKAEYQRSSEPNLNLTNRAPHGSLVLGHVSEGATQVPSPTVSVQEEFGKVRMKPRDPRHILHNNTARIGGTVTPDKPKVNASFSSAMSSNLGTSKQNDRPEKVGTSSTTKPPDITREFTNNLRNIADILSVTQASTSPIIPQILSSQSVQCHRGGSEPKGEVSESGNLKKGTGLVPEQVSAAPRPLKANAWSDVEHLFDGFDDQQKAAIQKERDRRLEEQNKLFVVRKLSLVLDLDHTLLNSAKFVEVDPMHDELLRKKEEQDREKPYRHLFRFPHMAMWTKLRPGIWNFLEKASKLYELHLYTMGNKYYATEMAKLLDPKGELFSGRVISRGDDGEPLDRDDSIPKTKDLDGILGMESSVVIIDDSVRVWPHHKLNLIAVERYIYFPCSRRQFGLPGPSLLEIDHDERPEDGTLASSLAVIERIHENFFAHESLDVVDVRDILASEQRKILCGCRIVFSRIFPVGEANPQMHPLWQTAEQFGAVCSNQMDDQVTHVVANSLGTDKVNWAHSNGRFVVHPGWVEASALLYRRANEHDFAIKQ